MEPRGIRNNNPLNIRKGNNWRGERHPQKDKSFEEFESMTYGVRAGFKILKNYMTGYGGKTACLNTVRLIIKRWAPPSENATERYIDFVATEMGVKATDVLSFRDRKTMVNLVNAMIFVECGQRVSRDIIESAYDMI